MSSIAPQKVEKLQGIANKHDLDVKTLVNGISLRGEVVSFTFYSGSNATYCIDRHTGKIQKGKGFDSFLEEIEKYFSCAFYEIDSKEVLKMLSENKAVYLLIGGDFVKIDEEETPISKIITYPAYSKKFSVMVNDVEFFNKQDAINYINRLES